MSDFLFRGSLEDWDPELHDLSRLEAERQFRKLILIPSESAAPLAVREALATAFQNVYAEGYPPEETRWMNEEDILDHEARLAHYRRYSDPRYYKGVEYADTVEALARRRCAEVFAANGVQPDDIFVNLQALSGAPANNAVYHALVEPGETVMGLNLLHGGHLSHGSPVNRSGKTYNIVHYTVDLDTERIDYDAVEALAREHQPKMIIAGYSSYPWAVDWTRFKEIAEVSNAFLLADIAHVAGLVAAGVNSSPIGLADVITFTTHKSLCGPRGAAILTTSPKLANRIDRAVFPGEQGGPHINTMVGQALAFKLATTDQFKQLQEQIVANCVTFTEGLEKAGFRIPYGGTDTHLMNLDCKSVQGPDGTKLSGDLAARVLDIAGIVVNRNTIPGDRSAAHPSGIRMGTSWITQRGFATKEINKLVEIIADLLHACTPYSLAGRKRTLTRVKVDPEILNLAKKEVRDLATQVGIDFTPDDHGYPHFYYDDDPVPQGRFTVLEIAGNQAEAFLRWTTTARPGEIGAKGSVKTRLIVRGEQVETVLTRSDENWRLTVPSEKAGEVLTWLRDLSDGYVTVDTQDLHKKIPGPVVVRLIEGVQEQSEGSLDGGGKDKPWAFGSVDTKGEPLPKFWWDEPEGGDRERTALYKDHKNLGAKMIPFAGWEMPVWYSSVLEEHQATRQAAGLFDVSHMGVYQVQGPGSAAFLDSVVANDVIGLAVGQSLYTQFLDPDARVIDDAMVYRHRDDSYLVVVNASNDDKDWAWLSAVRDGSVCIDNARPWSMVFGRDCGLRNLRDPAEGENMRVDLALQGPRSREILLGMGCDEATRAQIERLPWAGVMEGEFGGFDLIVSRTGYTGERTAYELFVHPKRIESLWRELLKFGEPLGLKPVGLGARDSLRTEAGLPLYGQEMAGELDLGVGDAGFAGYVKTYKPWFIGREAYLGQEIERKSEVVRFRFDDKGVRMAHHGDPVVDRRGRAIGVVTSCAVDSEGYLLGQAYLERKFGVAGALIAIFQGAAKESGKAPADLKVGDRVSIPNPATVLSRFPR